MLIDHKDPLARAYLRGLVERTPCASVCREAANSNEVIDALSVQPATPLALIDIDRPGMASDLRRSMPADRAAPAREAPPAFSARGEATCVVAGVRVAYPLPMVSVAQDEAQRRKAGIEAACRIALRMAGSGRGSEASLAFLLGVTARELGRVAMIVDEGEERETHCCPDAVPPDPYWATPIRARSGKLLGELRIVADASGELYDADLKALTTVARTAARIMARTDG